MIIKCVFIIILIEKANLYTIVNFYNIVVIFIIMLNSIKKRDIINIQNVYKLKERR